MSRAPFGDISSGDEMGGLPDLEPFGTLPRTFSDQEITVINDESQLNFLTFPNSTDVIDTGFSSEEDLVDFNVDTSLHSVKSQPRLSRRGLHGLGGSQPHLHAPLHTGHSAPALTYGQVMQPNSGLGIAVSPSKRMKRRLSHNSGLSSAGRSGGMLRVSSVPQMRSGPSVAAASATASQGKSLPPLKEKAKMPASTTKSKRTGSAGSRGSSAGSKGKKKESSSRRHRHNESERVRMRTIAAKITEMKQLMEETGIVVPKEKAKILTGAVEYMKHLKKVATQKSAQLTRVQEASTFGASPLPSCIMDAACNFVDSNRHFTRYFGPPHKAFPSAILLIPDWIYGRSVPQKVGMWLDLVQNLRNDHARLEGMQLEDQCVQHDGKTVNFRIIATLVNFHPSSSLKDIRILLTFFPLPVQAPIMTQLVPIKSHDFLHQQTAVEVRADRHDNQVASRGDGDDDDASFGE